jgi:hypothetical protein
MPWDLIGTVVLGLIKWIWGKKEGKKLTDAEFIAHLEAHQRNRQNTSNSTIDFDNAMAEARAKLKEENNG